MVYNNNEVKILREGGRRLAKILNELSKKAVPGVSTRELNALAEKLVRKSGDSPAFLGYKPAGADRPYPAATCISINDEVVHGVPTEKPKKLKGGDIVTIDMGLTHQGLIADSALTVSVGDHDEKTKALISVAKEALMAGIAAARAGNTVGDIGAAVEAYVKKSGFSVVKDLGGHGVGHSVHEEPFIPNFGEKGSGARLLPGMVLAIEPIVTDGSGEVELRDDGFTYYTKDGSRSAQFEHTVLVSDGEPEVLTEMIS